MKPLDHLNHDGMVPKVCGTCICACPCVCNCQEAMSEHRSDLTDSSRGEDVDLMKFDIYGPM